MWPMAIVAVHKYNDSSLKVLLVQKQQPVETFRADGAHEPLGDPVGLGRTKRRPNDLNSVAAEHVIETIRELLIPIANQKPHRFRALGQGPRQLPSLLNDPCRARIRRATGDMHRTAAQLDEEEDVEPLQPDRLDGEEIDGQEALGCTRTNSRHVIFPRLPASPRPAARSHPRTVIADTVMSRPFSSPTIRG
jgi:hypothetical protein